MSYEQEVDIMMGVATVGKNYSSIFTHGYCFGNIKEFQIDYSEFSTMCEMVRNTIGDKDRNFTYCDTMALRNYILKKQYHENIYEYFRGISLQIMQEIVPEYNYIPTQKGHFGDLLALMEERGFSAPHKDGDAGDLTLLIYLSDPDCYNESGNLTLLDNKGQKLNVETSIPVEGNYTIIETKTHNIAHKIEKIYGDFKRLAYVARIKRGTQ